MCAVENAINIDQIEDDFLRFCWQNLSPSARAKILANSTKTFWLFGAGASHHYNLNAFGVPVPLASGFFKAFHYLPTSQGFAASIGPLVSFLQHHRDVPPDKLGEWDANIEEFMTSVEKELEELKQSTKGRKLTSEEFMKVLSYAQVFDNMTFIFANVLNEAQNGASRSLYREILEICSPSDTFVTFNWDTLLDRSLMDTGGWNPNTGYGVKFRAVLDGSWKTSFEGEPTFPTEWKLIKLHGSTNWLVPYMSTSFQTLEYKSSVPASDSVFLYWYSSLPYATHKNRWTGGYVPTTYCYYPPNIPGEFFPEEQLLAPPGKVFSKVSLRFLAPFEEGDAKGVPSSPILITPVRQKKYDTYKSTVQNLWKQAEDALRDASRIVIIGYSFPPTDTRPLELFRSVLAERGTALEIEIVSPGVDDIAARIGHDYLDRAKRVTLRDMKLEEYIDVLYEPVPSILRKAAAESSDLRDWILRVYISSTLHLSSQK